MRVLIRGPISVKIKTELLPHVLRLGSKQSSLFAGSAKLRGIKFQPFVVQAVFMGVFPVLLGNDPRYIPFASHPYAPAAIIHFPVMAALDQMPYFIGPVGKVFI